MKSNVNIKSRVGAVVAVLVSLLLTALLVVPMAAHALDLTYDYQSKQDGNGVSDPTTKINISKLDSKSHEAVVDAVLAIIDKKTGQELVRWTTDGTTKMFDRMLTENVPLNVEQDYILREISAPNRYQVALDTEFRIGRFGTVVILNGDNAESVGKFAVNLYDDKLPAYADEYLTPTNYDGLDPDGDPSRAGDILIKQIKLLGTIAVIAACAFALLSLYSLFSRWVRNAHYGKHSV